VHHLLFKSEDGGSKFLRNIGNDVSARHITREDSNLLFSSSEVTASFGMREYFCSRMWSRTDCLLVNERTVKDTNTQLSHFTGSWNVVLWIRFIRPSISLKDAAYIMDHVKILLYYFYLFNKFGMSFIADIFISPWVLHQRHKCGLMPTWRHGTHQESFLSYHI
jgi:hypothetical protein